jgi:prepilin-type N-terminal cleavage/methylation domain-containing protein
MNRNKRGFTLVEVTVVVVLIGIIAAVLFARSISTDQINIVGQVDKIRNHIRYAQSMAMKHNATKGNATEGNVVWGFKSDGLSAGRYWIFTGDDPDNASNQVQLPGETAIKVSLPEAITMTAATIFFDKYGKPYSAYTDESNNTPLSSELAITVSGSLKNLTITPETGLITTQ